MREISSEEMELIAGGQSTVELFSPVSYLPNTTDPQPGSSQTSSVYFSTDGLNLNSHVADIQVVTSDGIDYNSSLANTGVSISFGPGSDGLLSTANFSFEIGGLANTNFSIDISQLQNGHSVTESLGGGHSVSWTPRKRLAFEGRI